VDIKTVSIVSGAGPAGPLVATRGVTARPSRETVGGRRRRQARQEGSMLVNLHLWEAPVRNLDWVTSAFGYR